ncbi:Serine/threonine-protein kinase plk1 [Entomophthora muscae]|uniref:Serine/threonine-protein kinase plk1 n=1 Tax=Entomophthora muscae TaxID=34485 RepID=A0ACC2U051_9FUNG|nr:Serine/threonine-protein kinase plk1 [Entomophthora muscae]
MTLRVGDFGIANELPPGQDYISTFYGTPECMAPETLDGEHSYEADMWALGIIMYYLLIGTLPFKVKYSISDTFAKICDSDFSFPAEATISSQAKELIKLILQTDPGYTPSSLSLLALQNNPQLSSVEKVTAKRSLDADGSEYSYHTTYPFISHKKLKFDAVLENPKHGHPRLSAQNKTANPLSQVALPALPPIRITCPSPVEEATIIKSTPSQGPEPVPSRRYNL